MHGDLREAAAHLAWLLDRGYAEPSSLKLVGDRFALRERQRTALRRSVAGASQANLRRGKRLEPSQLRDRDVVIDAFNVVIIVESALAGGLLLRGLDGALRDLASVHGNYRRMDATFRALDLIAAVLRSTRPASVQWLIDRPVSNSGRLRGWILERAPAELRWSAELPDDADPLLRRSEAVVASGDAWVLDGCQAWVDLPSAVVKAHVPRAWVLDLNRENQV